MSVATRHAPGTGRASVLPGDPDRVSGHGDTGHRWAFVVGRNNRALIRQWVERAHDGYRIEISQPRRTEAQNRLLWPLLTALSVQLKWHGLNLSPEDWKDLLTASFRKEARVVPNLEGNGFVALGMRTSTMSKAEFSDFIEFINAFGAENGVEFERDAA